MTRNWTGKSNQRGVNLLEVLVGIAIFALGMLALAQLQGSLARSSGDASARTTAINIAEEQMEGYRSFRQVEADPNGIFATYAEIVDSSESMQVGGVNFTVTTEVTEYYFDLGEDKFVPDRPADAVESDMKLVLLTVSWDTPGFGNSTETSDALGSGQIQLKDVISSITSISGAKVTLNASTSQLYAPPVDYSPGQNPDIIAIQLGDNKFKESTTPLPDVIRRNELTETKFDVVTYLQNNDGATFLRREEFLAVSCNCSLKIPTTATEGGRRPTVWDGVSYTEGEFVSKPYGVSSNNQQSIYCNLCCRDHHDGGTGAQDQAGDPDRAKVNPFRDYVDYWTATGDPLAGDHKHYRRDNSGNLIPVTANNAGYVEACRMVRKDGFFRVAQDLRQEGLNSFPGDYLDQESEISVYSDYVTDAVVEYEAGVPGSGSYAATPPSLTRPENMSPSVTFPASGPGNPTYLPTVLGNQTQQLRSRGVYVDYFSNDLRTIVNCLDLGGDGDSCGVPGVTSSLEVLPFYDVQLTWLSRWNEMPNNNPVDVTNEAIADDNTHSRGLAQLGSGSLMSTVDSEVHFGNLGMTGTDPINPFYANELRSYNLYVDANSGDTPPAVGDLVSGTITSAVNGVKASDVEILATEAQCDRTSTGFECFIETGASGPRLTVSNYGKQNKVLIACSNVLVTEVYVTGSTAWTRFLLPQATTPNADIVIRENSCS